LGALMINVFTLTNIFNYY